MAQLQAAIRQPLGQFAPLLFEDLLLPAEILFLLLLLKPLGRPLFALLLGHLPADRVGLDASLLHDQHQQHDQRTHRADQHGEEREQRNTDFRSARRVTLHAARSLEVRLRECFRSTCGVWPELPSRALIR